MTEQTVSSVHTEAEARKQRVCAYARERCVLNAMVLYAQLWIGFSLYLYDHVSTPGWISLLLTGPYAAALLYIGKFLASHTNGRDNLIVFAAGEKASKLFFILLSIPPLFDGFISFYALCALIRDVMPDHSAWEGAVAVAFTCAVSLDHGKEQALTHLGSFLKWIVGALFVYCFLIAIPHGKASHLFPIFGNGMNSILKGALWMCGAFSTAAWPYLTAGAEEQMLYKQKEVPIFRSVFILLLFSLITYGVSVWLLPFYAMARPQSLGWRLLLVAHMTPSIPAWSLEVIALLLLFMLALCVSIAHASAMLSKCIWRKKEPRFLKPILLMLMIPSCVTNTAHTKQIIILAAPWRAALSLLLLSILCLLSLLRTRGKGIREEKA